MSSYYSDDIKQLKSRVCKLQTAHVSLQDKLKSCQNDFERMLDDYSLCIIDVLDMIEMIRSNVDSMDEVNLSFERAMGKIEKRLINVLQSHDVEEISFKEGQIRIGEARVLETQKQASTDIPTGIIIKVCRKGYRRDNKIIRSADVITA